MAYNDRNKELVKNARSLRRNMTRSEAILWSRIRSKQIDGLKFRRQQPIFDYIVDFYCHELRLVIEVDGEIHDLEEVKKYDIRREKILKLNGYNVLRLTNFEVETNIDKTIGLIRNYISTLLSPS
jgi:very-short-patch-repair endonuclease